MIQGIALFFFCAIVEPEGMATCHVNGPGVGRSIPINVGSVIASQASRSRPISPTLARAPRAEQPLDLCAAIAAPVLDRHRAAAARARPRQAVVLGQAQQAGVQGAPPLFATPRATLALDLASICPAGQARSSKLHELRAKLPGGKQSSTGGAPQKYAPLDEEAGLGGGAAEAEGEGGGGRSGCCASNKYTDNRMMRLLGREGRVASGLPRPVPLGG